MQKKNFLSERTSLIAHYVSDQVQSKLFDLRLHGVFKAESTKDTYQACLSRR